MLKHLAIYYPYSDNVRTPLTDVIAVRVGIANAFYFLEHYLFDFYQKVIL